MKGAYAMKKERTLRIRGYSLCKSVYIQFFDMGLLLSEPKPEKKWLILFNAESDIATIDNAMPNWYAKIAILAEAIAYGKVFRPEFEQYEDYETNKRLLAEKYCLTKTETHRMVWLKARKFYYEFLLRRQGDKEKRTIFEEAMRFIEETIQAETNAIAV
jgi:hypothetical protein